MSQPSELVLWDHPVSSYAQKIRMALREKNLPFKKVMPGAIRTGKAEPEFYAASPRLEVPALVDGSVKIFDSTIILQYIEDKWPSPPLLPEDPAAKAAARTIEEICDTHYEAVNWGYGEIQFFGRASGELAEKMMAKAAEQTNLLQEWLAAQLQENPYFNGQTLGWADICVAPIVNRSRYYGLGPAPGSRLANWLDRIQGHTSVQETFKEFDAAVGKMADAKEAYLSGEKKREYRDHRLEWMIKSGGIDVVIDGLAKKNIRFSWPDPDI